MHHVEGDNVDIAIWDLVAPYLLLGDFAQDFHAALAVLAVEEHEVAADGGGIVVRGRARIFGNVEPPVIDPVNMTFSVAAANTEGHPRDDPTRREPWIDLADTTIDFQLVAPRQGSQTIAAALGSAAGDDRDVLNAFDPGGVSPGNALDPLPTDFASSAFTLDLTVTSAILRPPLLKPARLRPNGLLEPDPTIASVALILPRIKLRFTQGSGLDAPIELELLSLGASGMDDPGDPGVAQMVTMEPPYAFIGPGRTVGFGFRSAVLDLSDGSTPPDVLGQFGFDEAWTGVYFPEIRLFIAPQGAEGFAVSAGVRNLLIGVGASSGVTGDFEADLINQGTGPLHLSARFYGPDGAERGFTRLSETQGEVSLPERSRMVVDLSGGRPPYLVAIAVDGGAPVNERILEIDLAGVSERTIEITGTAPGSTDATLTIVAHRPSSQFTTQTTQGAVPAPTIAERTARRGAATVANPLIEIAEHSDTHVSLRLGDGSPADWTVDNAPAGTATRMITVPLAPSSSIAVTATGAATSTACPVYFRFDRPAVAEDLALHAANADNTRTAEAVDEPPSSGWTGGGPVAADATYRLALEQLPANGTIEVVGHASFEGNASSAEYNRLLSERRAKVARAIYEQIAPGRFDLAAADARGFADAQPAQANPTNPQPRRRWWRAELPSPVNVPGIESEAQVSRGPVPNLNTILEIPYRDPPPEHPEPPSWFRSVGAKMRIVRNEFVALELHGEIDVQTASEDALRNKAPNDDMPHFEGLGHQNPGDGIVAFRAVFTLDPGQDDWSFVFTFGADPSDVDGLMMTGVPAGQVVTDDSPGRNILGLYVLFMPLIAEAAPDNPTDPGAVGDLVLTGALATLPILLASSGWVTVQRVIWYGGEASVQQRDGAWSTTLLVDIETAVSVEIAFGGTPIVTIAPERPLVARYKAVGLRFGVAPDGSPIIRPVFDSSKGYTLDIARGGSLEVAEPLGRILKVVGARVSKTNPVMFEIELGSAVDLGVVSLDRVGVRVQLDDPTNIELTALGASVDIPGALTGSGYFQIADDGFAGRIDLTIVPIKLRVAASLNVRDIPADPPTHDGATAVAVALEVNFPVAIPLGASGLGIYGLVGLFAMHFQRNEDPDQGSATVALSWLKRAGGDPTHVEDPALWRPNIDSWAFGVGALLGTMGSDIIFNLKGMLLLELPGPRILLMMKAKLLMPAPKPVKGNAEGLLLAVVDLNVAEHSLTIGIVIDFSIAPLLELRIPVEALFDTDTPEQWHIFIGKYPDPIRAKILQVFTGTGYLMLVGDAQHDAPNLSPDLPGTTGFVIATGLHVSMLWGSKSIGLYAELAAGFDAMLGFSPLLVAGKLYLRGELRLFIISISAHAELDVRLGELPNDDSGYRIHGEVCGSIDLFFFEIEGCVDFTLEDNAPPEIAIPDLVGGLAIVNRSPALVHGTASDGPVDGALADAIRADNEPAWAGLPPEQQAVANVPIDAIPVVSFTSPPFDGPHPGNNALADVTFLGTSLGGASGGLVVKRSDDRITYELTKVDLVGPVLPPADPPVPPDTATPATWWILRKPEESNESAQLALMSWVPTPTPKAFQRSEELEETIEDRWGSVCSSAAPPTSVLWTFRFEPLGPSVPGWEVDGEAWPDPPDTVRSTPGPTVMSVTERWKCGDAFADSVRGIAPARVVGAIVGCPRDEPPGDRPGRPPLVSGRAGTTLTGGLPTTKAVLGRKRPEELVEPAIGFDEVIRRLATSAEIPRAALHATTTAFAAATSPRCPSRVLAAPCFDRLEPVPPWHHQYEVDVLERWNDRGFKPGDLANGVVIAPGEFVRGRLLLFVSRRLLSPQLLIVRTLADDATILDEHVVTAADEVTFATLPGEWTDPAGPWDDDIFLVMQHLGTLADDYAAVLVELGPPQEATSVLVGTRGDGALDVDKLTSGPPFYVAAVEALSVAELVREDWDTTNATKNHQVLEASLGAPSSKVALLAPSTAYRVVVEWQATATNPNVDDPVTTTGSANFWFRTAAEPPARLDQFVLATTPYEAEQHVFRDEPLQLVWATHDVLDVYAAHGDRLELRLQAASAKHPTAGLDDDGNEIDVPVVLDEISGPIVASVLSPWEATVIDVVDPDCIAVDEERIRHSLTSATIPLEPLTDYLLDIERVPAASQPGTGGERVLRRSFATSRFRTLAELAEHMRGVRVLHRYAPAGAMGVVDGALTSDAPPGEAFDEAWENAGLERMAVPDTPRLTVFWEGGGTPQPTALLLDCSEPLWRERERADLVTIAGTDIEHWELGRAPWVEPRRAAGSTTTVTRTVRTPGGQRGLMFLAPNSRGTHLLVELLRRAFTAPYLDGAAAVDEAEAVADITFTRAPWEEV